MTSRLLLRLCCALSSSRVGCGHPELSCISGYGGRVVQEGRAEKWHLSSSRLFRPEAEKQELENQRVIKEQALQEALEQLQQLELERKQALEQYEVITPSLQIHAFKFLNI